MAAVFFHYHVKDQLQKNGTSRKSEHRVGNQKLYKMSLSFLTQPQQMIFVDPVTNNLINAGSLLPNKDYSVYFTIQNDSPMAVTGETISLSHSAFGIGLPGGPSLLTPNPIVVPVIPPMAFGINGQVTCSFNFHTPAGGHGCLVATINSNQVSLNQNSSVIGVPSGLSSTTSFLLFGNAATNVTLTLTEKTDNAGMLTIADAMTTWNPMMIAPPGLGPTIPVASPMMVTGLGATDFYTVGLQVNAVNAPMMTHVFNIVGTNTDTGAYIGEVDIRLVPAAIEDTPEPSRPFIHGGYQSADIILTDPITGINVPLGGAPGGVWDTLLRAETDYGFSARVFNDSETPAVNTVVRFWKFPGGVGSNGTLVDIQTVTVPANDFVIVHSAHPFHSAPSQQHSCAAVSIYNAMAGRCATDAVTALDVPDPGGDMHISCSAWRNTDSMWAFPGRPWWFDLNLGLANPVLGPDPVEIKFEAQIVPHNWKKNPRFKETIANLRNAGVEPNKPLFLLPTLRETFEKADLNITIKGEKIEGGRYDNTHTISFEKGKNTAFKVEGVTPKDAQKGDILLVKITAAYPETKLSKARNVEFLQVLHVTDREK